MECIQNEKKVLNTDINKLNWRFNQIFFSDHKPGHLLYDTQRTTTRESGYTSSWEGSIQTYEQFYNSQGP